MATEVTKRVVSVFLEDGQASKSLKGLTAESRKLYNELANLPRGSDAFIAKSKEFQRVQRDLKGIREEVNGTGGVFNKLTGMLGPIGPAIAGAFAVDAVIGFGKESVNAFREAEKASAKVEQAIVSTGGAAGLTLDELKAKASELQGITLFDDDTILNKASAQLLTFTNIAEEEFFRAQEAAMNLATVLDGDLQSASIMVGKALNDPIKGLTAMGRAGVQFSEDQKAMIESLVQNNDLIGAQTIILGELEKQYGGQAEAAAKADGGVTQLGNAWGDFQETLGGALMGIFDTADGASLLTVGVQKLSDGVTWLVGKVGEARDWFVNLYNSSILLRGGIGDAMIVIKTAWDAVVLSFQVGYQAIVTPIKAIGALLTGDFKGAFNAVKEGVTNVFGSAKEFATNVVGNVKDAIKEVDDPQMFKPVEKAAAATKPLIKVGVQVEGDGEGMTEGAMAKVKKAIEDAQEDMRRSRLTGTQREIGDVRAKYGELIALAEGHTAEIAELERLRDAEITAIRVKAGQKDVDRLKKLDEEIKAIREDQRIAKLSEDEQEELKALEKFAKLEEAAKGHADRLAEIDVLKTEALRAIREERADEEAEAQRAWEETMEAERQSSSERDRELLQAKHEEELAMAEAAGLAMDELLARQREEKLAREEELRERDLELINERFEELYAIADQQGFDTTELQRLHGQAIHQLNAEYAAQGLALRRETDAKMLDSQRKRAEAEKAVVASVFSITRDLFTASGADADEMATFNKAMTLFTIGLDTAEAISALTANSEANPANAVTGGTAGIVQFAAGFARITANIAKATQLLGKQQPTAPEFYVGGGTGDAIHSYINPGTGPVTVSRAPNVSAGGTVSNKTLGWFGERGPEWVAPNWMYEHPTMQPLFAHLEYVRTTGALPAFEVGGATSTTTTPIAPQQSATVDRSAEVLGALAMAVNGLNERLASGIQAQVNNDQLETNTERLERIRRESQLI